MRRAQQRVRLAAACRENGWMSAWLRQGTPEPLLLSTDEGRLFQWQNRTAGPAQLRLVPLELGDLIRSRMRLLRRIARRSITCYARPNGFDLQRTRLRRFWRGDIAQQLPGCALRRVCYSPTGKFRALSPRSFIFSTAGRHAKFRKGRFCHSRATGCRAFLQNTRMSGSSAPATCVAKASRMQDLAGSRPPGQTGESLGGSEGSQKHGE